MTERTSEEQSFPTMVHEAASKGFQVAGDAYERGRPDYPQDAVAHIAREAHIEPGKRVVDLGAGTGKFTRLIQVYGADLTSVEPVAGMRAKFAQLSPNTPVLEGTAEHMPFADASLDTITVAQSFHWFDGAKAINEIARVLKPNGTLAMIWNSRDESIDWIERLTVLIDVHEAGAPRYKSAQWKKAFVETTKLTPLKEKIFGYIQTGPPEMVVDRIASISFISALDAATKANVLEQTRELLKTHPETRNKQTIELPYRTDVFTCRKV